MAPSKSSDALTKALAAIFSSDKFVTSSSDPVAFSSALERWASSAVLTAKCVVFPKTSQDVSEAIKFYTSHQNDQGSDLKDLAIKGGGHSTSGSSSSDGGMVIDLGKYMNKAKVIEGKDKDGNVAKFIKAEGGSLLRAVNEAGAEHGIGCVVGVVDHTGTGGLTVGGGYGWLSPKYGLTIDALEEVEVVVANGDIIIANEQNEHSDLFWGVRGGGSNFGPVTSFTFRTFSLPSNGFWAGSLVFAPPQYDALFNAVAEYKKTIQNDPTRKSNENILIGFARMPPEFQPAVIVIPMVYDPPSIADARSRFQHFFDVNPVADLTPSEPSQLLNYVSLNKNPMAFHGPRCLFKGASFSAAQEVIDNLGEIFKPVWKEFVSFTEEHEEIGKTPGTGILMEMGDWEKVCEVGKEATAFSNRGAWYTVNISPRWTDPTLDPIIRQWTRKVAAIIQERGFPQQRVGDDQKEKKNEIPFGYTNYGSGEERAREVFGDNYEHLRKIKAKYDPDVVFKKWYPIQP